MIWAGEELLLGGMRNFPVMGLQQHPEITFGVGAPNLRVKLAALIIVQSKKCCTVG